MRVQPADEPRYPSQADATSSPTRRVWATWLGCAYVCASMVSSIYFLLIVNPSFRNDLWWANYAPTTDQALLIDLFNVALTTRATGTVDLLSPSSVVDKCYTGDEATAAVFPTYVRQLSLAALSNQVAVASLRNLSAAGCLWLATQFCWVDLNHTFELAHTGGRQERCVARYATNGAVYLETVLRNQVWGDFLAAYGTTFYVGIQSWLEQIPSGQVWLAVTSTARSMTTVDQEVVYWRAHNITTFQLQWQNGVQMGVSETLLIENALGLQQDLVVKNIPLQSHLWTSVELNWLFPNDLGGLAQSNASLIRSATNSFLTLPFNIEDMFGLQQPNGNYIDQVQVFRTHLGAFLSVDAMYIAIPRPLVDLYLAFQSALHAEMRSNPSLHTTLDAISTLSFAPTPPKWVANSTWMYYGGNPLCLSGLPLPYVQETFSFDDGCNTQPPLTVAMTKYSSLFATLLLGPALDIPTACALLQGPNVVPDCQASLTAMQHLAASMARVQSAMAPFIVPVLAAVRHLNVSLVQFATHDDGSNWTLLRQPIVDNSSAWDVFGWTFLFDWVQGTREVVSFEGDVASLVLVSATMPANIFISSAQSDKAATRGLYYAAVYVTCVLAAVTLACAFKLVALGCRMQGSNLVWFNPVVSSIWIGRPLVFVRGLTAILVLSTSQLNLVNTPLHAWFTCMARPWLDTAILAGEATWVLYAVIDFCTVLTPGHATAIYGPVSCVLSWACLVGLEVLAPVVPTMTLDRTCTFQDLNSNLKCASGRVEIGSVRRLGVICAVQAVAFLSSLALGCHCVLQRRRRRQTQGSTRHSLGIADLFLQNQPGPYQAGAIDGVSRILAGYVPFVWRQCTYTFDVKLWVIHTCGARSPTAKHLNVVPPRQTHAAQFGPTVSTILTKAGSLVGMAYAVGSIFGSVSYLQLSQVNLANDMFWASFNVTGAHAFLANWLNAELSLGATDNAVELNADWINMDGSFKSPTRTVVAPRNHGAHLQYSELNTLQGTIQGLRATDACKLPWIFTPYCFVDFSQRWEMANTAKRQGRCQTMTTNGAVFLDSMLRNTNFVNFYACWGSAFDVAVANDLKQSSAGLEWMTNVTTQVKLEPADEVLYWQAHGIDRFDTQWQNFKLIGVVNSYSVWTAFGISYPFTLQSQKSVFRWNEATTLKMYWGLASDLDAVTYNASGIGGASLVRSSSTYAFANTTMESVVLRNGTMSAPSDSALALVQHTIGPFGSIDMHYVACPLAVKSVVRSILRLLRQVLFQRNTSSAAYSLIDYDSRMLAPVPKAWTDVGFETIGGSPLCAGGFSIPVTTGMLVLLSWDNQCSQTAPSATVSPSTEAMIASAVLANLSFSSPDDIAAVCAQNVVSSVACQTFLNATISFVRLYMLDRLNTMSSMVVAANAMVLAKQVELVQFGHMLPDAPLALYRYRLLDPLQPEFTYFAWLFLIDWVQGTRDVVRFEGDFGTITLLTEPSTAYSSPVNVAEDQVGMVVYLRNTVVYVTVAMMFVAGLMIVYIILSRGHIELLNLWELQRVGAIVWIGRPLLFVRSLTAVALLSTCILELKCNGSLSYFQVTANPWYKTILAANEVTWLVAIANDIAMAFTKEYTVYYTTLSSTLIWAFSVTMSFTSPLTHLLTIEKQCHLTQVDFQVVCDSGVLYIGHVARLTTIAGVVLGVNVVCYVATRVWFQRLRSTPIHSIFLYAGARYLFETSKWIVDDVYYMDRMSAALNGILTLRWGGTMYCLDVKLWRTFQVETTDKYTLHATTATAFALPLRLDAIE
ncbi:Aste57867_13403 [Aphanomyces stellatus]|uniref:Aste57867_13403 protein n=1 Tax=Aphanomyces stellatus TaxID=120398 RepID=A0A485KYA3_9STRA|nr:hypothetical protein As57867_013353 [Aphanomyces stellatus]VFT90242.1 Aste57867_13403 [Aphanomyces stellatus]